MLIIARIIIYGSFSLDANKRDTDYLFNHLRDPSGTVAFSQAIEAPVSISFVPTVRAAELR
jgi:hypothetical protein